MTPRGWSYSLISGLLLIGWFFPVLSCKIPVAPVSEPPPPFQNVLWDELPGDFLLSIFETKTQPSEPFYILSYTSRVYRFNAASRTISIFLESSNSYVFNSIALSPDGSTLAFARADLETSGTTFYQRGYQSLYMLNIPSGQLTRYDNDSTVSHSLLAWSPQGNLAYATTDSGGLLWVDRVPVASPIHPQMQPQWSDDGGFLYFTRGASFSEDTPQRFQMSTSLASTILTASSPLLKPGVVHLFNCLPTAQGIYVSATRDSSGTFRPYRFFVSYDGTSVTETSLSMTGKAFVFPTNRRKVLFLLGSAVYLADTETGVRRELFQGLPGSINGFCPVF